MAAEPPLASRKVFSGFSTPHAHAHVESHGLHLVETHQQFGAIIHEIERVRSRFENEKSNSDQFSQQMRMLAQQIEDLTNQQSSMIGFHIGRMDAMLKELKNSCHTISNAKQRAAFEAEQHAKFEQERRERERIKREHLERERLERERIKHDERMERERIECERTEREEERERQLLNEKFERERRTREENEREQREREQEEREHRNKLETLRRCSLPTMDLSDIIPQPSRTVTASKRKLSLDDAHADSSSSFLSSQESNAAKRAKICGADLALALPPSDNITAGGAGSNEPQSNITGGPVDMDTSTDAAKSSSPIGDPDGGLPVDIQEMLKQQALAMLQAQLAAVPTEHASTVKLEMPSATDRGHPSSSPNSSSHERPSTFAEVETGPTANNESAVTVVKPESTLTGVKPKKSAASAKSSSKRAKKAATPAVEDTSIVDPMSIPLKNKAIHQWMSRDPERLYSADDICKAGIRYRANQANSRSGTQKGKVYILCCRHEVRSLLKDKYNNKKLWMFDGGWKVLPLALLSR